MARLGDIPREKLLGSGLYTPGEAGRFIEARASTVSKWLHGTSRMAPVVRAEFEGHRGVISFVDMVQALAIRALRDHGVPLQRIRQAVEWFGITHPEMHFPFARLHKTYRLTTTGDLAVVLPGDDKQQVLQVSGRDPGQFVMADVMDEYLERLEFNEERLATKYVPLRREGVHIELDPRIRFGQPRVMPSGYMVETFVDSVDTEGIVGAARLYGVERRQVELALEYHQSLWGRPNGRRAQGVA